MSIQQDELDDARRGTVFFLSKLTISTTPDFSSGLIGNFVSGTSIVTDLQHVSSNLLGKFDAGKKFNSGFAKIIDPVTDLLSSFVEAMIRRIGKLYGESSALMIWVSEFGAWLTANFVGSLSEIILGWGYVQDAADMYDAVKKSVTSAIRWLGQVMSGWGVQLLEGGPSIMAEAIARHNALSVAGGLKDLAITGTKIGLKAAGDAVAAVGSIIGAVTGILQRLANLVEYCIQRFLLSRIIDQARDHWKNDGYYLTDHDAFTSWFRNACAFTPIVSALTIHSGFAAHPYRFIALISKQDEIVSQEEFDKGVAYIDKLKEHGRQYIKQYQESYGIKFESDDSIVKSRLQHVNQ